MAPEDITEALSQQREDSMDAASSQIRDDSLVDTGDSDIESWSGDSKDRAFKSDSSKWLKVATVDATAEIDCGFSPIVSCMVKSFICFFESLEVCNSYMPRITKVLKAAMLGRTNEHTEKSEQRTIIFGICEILIHLGFVAT
jgi:hypothetical protein